MAKKRCLNCDLTRIYNQFKKKMEKSNKEEEIVVVEKKAKKRPVKKKKTENTIEENIQTETPEEQVEIAAEDEIK